MCTGSNRGRLRVDVKRVVVCVMIFSCSGVARAYVSGRLDTQLETEQAAYYSRHYIEQQAEINWLSKKQTMHAGVQFDLRYKETDVPDYLDNRADQQINQLFFSQRTAAIDYTLGRFNRSDLLGFYSLDGVQADYAGNDWRAGFHVGRPRQLENYHAIDAGRIYGLDVTQQFSHIDNVLMQNASVHAGWQQLYKETKQNYLHWRFSTEGDLAKGKTAPQPIKLFFTGNYLLENNAAETINAGVQFSSEDAGLARVSYNRWNPKQTRLSFKELFYSVYANGRQTTLQGELFRQHQWNQQYYVRGRKVWREFGNNGYGISAGFEKKAASEKKFNWQLQWDSLALKEDVVHSLYLGCDKSVSATMRARFNTALQYKDTSLEKSSRVLALQVVVERMLQSDLFIDFNARYIYDENLQDEYRFSFRLSYRFDDSSWSGR